MTKKELNLISKVILETATLEDFFSVSRNFMTLRNLFIRQKSLLSNWHIEVYASDTFFDIEPEGVTSGDASETLYRVSGYMDQKRILYIAHRGVNLT